jgi:methionine synthase II (cobalamin-independent)
MERSTSRILTTHTGALHRPPDLEELYRKKFVGEPYDTAALEARLQSSVEEVVRQQADLGIDVIDDGELSKLSFWAYARSRLSGLVSRPLGTDHRPGDKFFTRAGQTASSGQDRQRFNSFTRIRNHRAALRYRRASSNFMCHSAARSNRPHHMPW